MYRNAIARGVGRSAYECHLPDIPRLVRIVEESIMRAFALASLVSPFSPSNNAHAQTWPDRKRARS